MTHTATYHELLKRNDRAWALLDQLEPMHCFDDDDQPMVLAMANCSCRSTLCRKQETR